MISILTEYNKSALVLSYLVRLASLKELHKGV